MSQKLRTPPFGRGWISRRFGSAGAALYMSVIFAALSLGHAAVSAPSDTTDLPQEGRDIIAAPDSVAAGHRLFGLNCTYCHGAKGIGGRGRLLQCRDDLTAAIIFETITNGRNSLTATTDLARIPCRTLQIREITSSIQQRSS